ncbi:hypothetical protein ISN45_Aa08g004400 [Arabidopsis thaliana x Arabidopsis arenosa]|uniref:Uncharacterized protein n=2 Tax=Arabidopsis thaliana x Arabidopsis arenosa TaxID=1240361 RepID=A0A8T1XJK5_9BRAS|nr:hypothetical protein ISN45_Aa08g004400 [Arabidopsis thaliana x Arabidopsis arenosa]
MSSDSDRPESPSYDGKRSSLDDCTRPNDIAGPHYRSTCTIQSLQRLKELCRLPPDVMAESKMADPTESPEDHRDGYFCVYEIYFKGCGLTFPLPEALVRYLAALEISLPQLTPNLLRTILGIITVAAEAGYIIGVPELNELLSVRSSSKKAGYFSAYPNANRNIISHLPNKDENWHHPWFLIKKTPASIGNLSDVLPSKWSAKPAFIAPTLPTEDFVRFFKILLEGETLWNSFTLDRFIEANRKLRMSPPGQLQRLPPPPPSQGMSARALAAQRKKLSIPITKACDENKALLAAAFDKKDYSRSLLVDDGTAEGARSTGAYRLTPRRERPKRDKSSRSDSSPQREKSRARTERSPRSSPPAEPMGPPPPVDMSSQHSGEKTARNVSPQKESSESQDAPPKSRPALVPQIKSLTAMEKEGSVFRCFKTRSGLILPEFDKWRPAIRERYLLHAHHSSRANSELNDMIEHYEGLLLSQQQEIELWRGKFTTLEFDLQSSSGSKHQLEDQVDGLKSELEKIKGDLKDQYDQNYQLQNELSGVQGRLHDSESSADALNNQLIELRAKYNAITKLRDSELARSASKARKEVKGRGMELIQGAIRFIQTEKVKSDLESDIKEHESNLILLDQIHDDDFSEVKERSELASSLSEKKNRLAALLASSFNPQDFAEFFTESPPLSESGLDWAGPSETEGVVLSEVPAAPKVIPGDVCTAVNEQGTSPEQVPAKEADGNPTTEVEGCGLTFPLPEALVRYLAALEISLPQLTPNLLRTILGIITVAAEAGYHRSPRAERTSKREEFIKESGVFSAYPNARNIISHLPNKDETGTILAFIAPTLQLRTSSDSSKSSSKGKPLEFFHLDRFIEANRKLRMSPPGQLQAFRPLPSQGMSARALAAQRKKLSIPITRLCDENKALLAAAFDKKDYSRSLLVDDGTAEGARSTGGLQANASKRDKSSRSDSSPQREKSRARTERSPRSSPPAEPMGPPPPVDMSSQHSGEKTARNVSPQKESSESQDAPPKSRPALVPQIKSLTAMEKEGSVFRCFKTRSGLILPEFDKWRPAIRERYLLHAHHSSRGRLHDSESSADALNNQLIELRAKYNAITKLRDSELARSASKARKEDFAEFFTESPPLSESGLDWAGPSETEGVVLSEVPAAPKVIPGDVCTAVNEQGTSPEQVPAKEADGNPTTEVEVGVPADPGKTLEARIARVERKVRALESDPFQWEWRNFDCIAEIPRMLRMYLRAKGQVQGPVNAPTDAALVDNEEEDEENDDNPWKRVPKEPEVEGMEFNLRCSESMPDFSRIGMVNEDVPNEPNRRSSPPRGFFRSQIRAPCALIKNLPFRDQGTAMAFIEALALQHRKLTLEKKRLRKRINRMQRRLTTVSRDLHILGSHPGDWIELGISDFARIPDCMMPVLDLAGQGVQVFCSPGGFS